MDIPENWIHSPGIFPYPGNGDNKAPFPRAKQIKLSLLHSSINQHTSPNQLINNDNDQTHYSGDCLGGVSRVLVG